MNTHTTQTPSDDNSGPVYTLHAITDALAKAASLNADPYDEWEYVVVAVSEQVARIAAIDEQGYLVGSF